MKKLMLCLFAFAIPAACQLPDLTTISWVQVNPQGDPAPSFLNNWANTGGATEPLRFEKDALDQVHIVGAIANSGLVGSVDLFQLPVAYRPGHDKYLSVIVSDGSSSGLGELRITASNGMVRLYTYIGSIQYARFSDVIYTMD